jgi:hypothetical protein
VEVTLALGIVGMAILSLVGILGATFQQADEIMQTNRALSAATRLIGAFDNPRSIVKFDSNGATSQSKFSSAASTVSNFELIYNEFQSNGTVWFYVYDRKISTPIQEFTQVDGVSTYNIYSNPTVTEVALASESPILNPKVANARNIVGNPIRVKVTLSKLLVGQRPAIDQITFEPTVGTWNGTSISPTTGSGVPSSGLPNAKFYALAYLPVVAEFYPHDWTDVTTTTPPAETPVLVQTIIISR